MFNINYAKAILDHLVMQGSTNGSSGVATTDTISNYGAELELFKKLPTPNGDGYQKITMPGYKSRALYGYNIRGDQVFANYAEYVDELNSYKISNTASIQMHAIEERAPNKESGIPDSNGRITLQDVPDGEAIVEESVVVYETAAPNNKPSFTIDDNVVTITNAAQGTSYTVQYNTGEIVLGFGIFGAVTAVSTKKEIIAWGPLIDENGDPVTDGHITENHTVGINGEITLLKTPNIGTVVVYDKNDDGGTPLTINVLGNSVTISGSNEGDAVIAHYKVDRTAPILDSGAVPIFYPDDFALLFGGENGGLEAAMCNGVLNTIVQAKSTSAKTGTTSYQLRTKYPELALFTTLPNVDGSGAVEVPSSISISQTETLTLNEDRRATLSGVPIDGDIEVYAYGDDNGDELSATLTNRTIEVGEASEGDKVIVHYAQSVNTGYGRKTLWGDAPTSGEAQFSKRSYYNGQYKKCIIQNTDEIQMPNLSLELPNENKYYVVGFGIYAAGGDEDIPSSQKRLVAWGPLVDANGDRVVASQDSNVNTAPILTRGSVPIFYKQNFKLLLGGDSSDQSGDIWVDLEGITLTASGGTFGSIQHITDSIQVIPTFVPSNASDQTVEWSVSDLNGGSTTPVRKLNSFERDETLVANANGVISLSYIPDSDLAVYEKINDGIVSMKLTIEINDDNSGKNVIVYLDNNENLVANSEGKITLSALPKAESLNVYSNSDILHTTPLTTSVSGQVVTIDGAGDGDEYVAIYKRKAQESDGDFVAHYTPKGNVYIAASDKGSASIKVVGDQGKSATQNITSAVITPTAIEFSAPSYTVRKLPSTGTYPTDDIYLANIKARILPEGINPDDFDIDFTCVNTNDTSLLSNPQRTSISIDSKDHYATYKFRVVSTASAPRTIPIQANLVDKRLKKFEFPEEDARKSLNTIYSTVGVNVTSTSY